METSPHQNDPECGIRGDEDHVNLRDGQKTTALCNEIR